MDMNWFSHSKHENRRCESSPPPGPSRGTAGPFPVFSKMLTVIDPPRGRPFGGAALLARGGMGVSISIVLSERIRFSGEIIQETMILLGACSPAPAAMSPPFWNSDELPV